VTSTRKVLYTNNTAMVLYGLSAVLIGPTLPGMITSLNLSLSQAGFISAMQNAGGFFGAFLTLFIADRIGHNKMVVLSFVLLGIGFITVGLAESYGVLIFTFALTGFFIRILDVMLNSSTGDFARLETERTTSSGKAMSTLHMFFSIGAFVGPVAAQAIMGVGLRWSQVFGSIGLAYLGIVGVSFRWLRVYARTNPDTGTSPEPGTEPITEAPAPATADGADPAARSGKSAIALLSGLLFFYAIHQVGISSWVPFFLETARGVGPTVASLGLSAYWVGIIGGRYISSRIVGRIGAHAILVIGCLVSAAATLAAVFTPNVLAAQIFFTLAGVTSGSTIPLGYSIAYGFTTTRTGAITALVSLVMILGRFIGPWAIGLVADTIGLIGAMTLPSWAALFSGLLGAIVWWRQKVSNDNQTPRPHRGGISI